METENSGRKGVESSLVKNKEYNKKEAHDILDPETKFYYYAGKWGINGLIKIGGYQKDYVLFVTVGTDSDYYGKQQRINKDGTLIWCAPRSMNSESANLKRLLEHDPEKHGVYLFARKAKDKGKDGERKYYYVGKLDRPIVMDSGDKPILLSWKIINWDENSDHFKHLLEY